MSVNIPKNIKNDIKKLIYARLDECSYLSQTMRENGAVMERLARDPDIGGKIAEYTGREKVKTYIKDAMINKYSKLRTKAPDDLSDIVASVFGGTAKKQPSRPPSKGVDVYKNNKGDLVIVSSGRLLKWESALRKLLEHIGRDLSSTGASRPAHKMLIVLVSGGKKIPPADVQHLQRSLGSINVQIKIL
jgi:hypothetical protein